MGIEVVGGSTPGLGLYANYKNMNGGLPAHSQCFWLGCPVGLDLHTPWQARASAIQMLISQLLLLYLRDRKSVV